MRLGLYDIDIFISRTRVYGSLAVFITAVYVGIAVGIGTLVGNGGKPNLALSILATAIVAFGFQPVRERIQIVANRLVYGQRATPYEVLSEFSGRVAETYAADEVLPRMARVLGEGTARSWRRCGCRESPSCVPQPPFRTPWLRFAADAEWNATRSAGGGPRGGGAPSGRAAQGAIAVCHKALRNVAIAAEAACSHATAPSCRRVGAKCRRQPH